MMNELILRMLRCPVCGGKLEASDGAMRCVGCGLEFPSSRDVPCLFGPGKEDLWARTQSGMAQLIEEEPEMIRQLEDTPEDELNGADMAAKSGLRQAQGRFLEAAELHSRAMERCYPEAYMQGLREQMEFIARELGGCPGPVLDIASGRGMLISRLIARVQAPLIASDISPTVLANYQASRWQGLVDDGRLSLLAFDATEMPFGDGAVGAMTTCLGLQNIPDTEKAARELRRMCGGKLYALCQFFREDDQANQEAAAKSGLPGALSREKLTGLMERCGWQVSCNEGQWFTQQPTPVGEIVQGMTVDGLPVAEAESCFCTLICE